MALKVINKINLRLKFLHRKNKFLMPAPHRLLCNALIQPHFDYASSAWYPNVTQKMKNKTQFTQNTCIRYCLQLNKMTHISKNDFETLKWLPVKDRFNQSIHSIAFKYFTQQCPSYLFFELACPNKLKLVSTIFYQIFISHQMIDLQKLWKMLFISSKTLSSFSRY